MGSHRLSRGVFASALFSLAITRSTPQEAATTVSADSSNAGFPLFDAERVQVNHQILNAVRNLDSPTGFAKQFAFDDESLEDISASPSQQSGFCKLLPGDPSWPSDDIWDFFSGLLGGALVPVVPLASPCYLNSVYNNYDEKTCDAIRTNFTTPEIHTEDPGSIMFPIYEGRTCLPTKDPHGTCTQGGFTSYAVNVSSVAHIQLSLIFARLANVRLVIRNTGHDYNGRSTGAGALSIWTHHLKDIAFHSEYQGAGYQGPAMKVGAGAQGFEVYEAADKYGVSIVGGLCPSIGFAGGYISGGGHSPLMSLYGMAADQLLALEVVTADGRFVTATPDNNGDLFWALAGGGGGTFGVVASVIVKAHSKTPATTSMISFGTSDTVSVDAFWEGVQAYWDNFLPYIDANTYSYFWITNTSGNYTFLMTPFYAPLHTVDQFDKLVNPWLDRLHELNIPFEANTTYHETFLSSYATTFARLDWGVGAYTILPGVRLLPLTIWEDPATRNSTFTIVRNTVTTHGTVGGYHQHPNRPHLHIPNSVNPHFRNEACFLILGARIAGVAEPAELREAGRTLTFDIMGPLREISSGGGAYANEADVNEQRWQEAFWGGNYPRLWGLKRWLDRRGLFYVHHGVGSELWEVRDGDVGVQTQNGRLCRV